MLFERLIRFVNDKGEVCYGDVTKGVDVGSIVGNKVRVVDGSAKTGFTSSNTESVVKQVCLCCTESVIPLTER